MARGRMISNSISESRKFAALASHEHRLIYLMVLPWADKAGRFEADPVIIKSKCLLRLNVDLSTVQAWLKDAANVGLINVYEVDGIPVLEIVGFLEHNTPHHKEPESHFPGPEAATARPPAETPSSTPPVKHDASMAQASAKHEPTLPIIEVEVEEELEVEDKERLASPNGATPPPKIKDPPKRKGRKPKPHEFNPAQAAAALPENFDRDLFQEWLAGRLEHSPPSPMTERALRQFVERHKHHPPPILDAMFRRAIQGGSKGVWLDLRPLDDRELTALTTATKARAPDALAQYEHLRGGGS